MTIYFILVNTFKQGKLTEDAIIPFYCPTKKLGESAVRILASKLFEKYKNQGKKPKIEVSYSSEMIAKGKCRVYFTEGLNKKCYTSLRLYALEGVYTIDEIREKLE